MLLENHALLHAPTATAIQLQTASTLNLSDLSSDDMLRLRMSVNEFRSAGRRMVGELYVMTTQLSVMKEILGDRFRAFVEGELGLSPRMVTRYMHVHNVLNTHFMVEGKVDLSEANAFTQRALALLTPTTETTVVESLREMAREGTTINEKIVMDVMSKAEEDAVAQLASTQADLTARTRELDSERQAREVERARAQREISSQAELIRRGEQRAKDLEDDLQKLQKQATQVQFQDKEVVPAGYASVEAAIAAKTAELQALANQREALSTSVQNLTEQQQQLQVSIEQTNAGAEKFLEMKAQADALIAHFPTALLKSLSESDPTVKAAIASLGQTMVLFGQQLAKASS